MVITYVKLEEYLNDLFKTQVPFEHLSWARVIFQKKKKTQKSHLDQYEDYHINSRTFIIIFLLCHWIVINLMNKTHCIVTRTVFYYLAL